MTFEAVFNPKCYTDDSWVVHIRGNLLHAKELEDLQNSHGDRVRRVPKSLRSAKPEAFIPQFVGLGPYHHCRPELIMTQNWKLAAARWALKDLFHLDLDSEKEQKRLKNFVPVSDIKARYQIDVSFTYNDQTLLYVLAVDGLFLLGLLYTGATANPARQSCFLTGKNQMALVNADGVELTMDFIFRDVFMLENQIPTHFLKQITETVIGKEIQPLGDLGLKMRNFCKELCPLVQVENPSKYPEEHHHLLDLMYHLVVPESMLQSQPGPESQPGNPISDAWNSIATAIGGSLLLMCCLTYLICVCESESESDSEHEHEHEHEHKHKPPRDGKDQPGCKDIIRERCSKCWNIPLILVVFVCLAVAFMVVLILELLLWMLRSLFSMVQWALGRLVWLSTFIGPAVDKLHGYLSNNSALANVSSLRAFTNFVGKINETCKQIGSTKVDKDARPTVTIPSVTELHSAGIHFQPAQGGISSIRFDKENCQFHLPKIKVNVNSEVIIRNLVAYETLTKTKGLIFTRYIELMRAIIDTPQDVNLLVQNQIIDTKLSDEVVAQLFNGMSKSIKPTETPTLEEVIRKVKEWFDRTQWLKRATTKYVYSSWKLFTAVAALVFLVLAAVQTYCSVFGCSRASKSAILSEDGDYATNNIFTSSM